MQQFKTIQVDTEANHYYSENHAVYYVSGEAAQECQKNWQEIHGWAIGSAVVNHPDWLAVLEHLAQSCASHSFFNACHGSAYLVIVRQVNTDKLAFTGSICRNRDGGILLEG